MFPNKSQIWAPVPGVPHNMSHVLWPTTAQVHCSIYRHFTTCRTATFFPQEGPRASLSRIRNLTFEVGLVNNCNSTFALRCSHGGVYVVTYSARKQPGLPQMSQPSLWLHRARRFEQYQENKPLWKRKKFSATPVYSEVVLLDGTHLLNAPMWEEPVSACYVKQQTKATPGWR